MAIASLGALGGSAATALPPGTVQYGQASGASMAYGIRSTVAAGSSSQEAAVEGSLATASYDESYSTPLANLRALGLLQPGDVLTGSSVRIMEQQTQVADSQSLSASQQATSDSDGTQSSASVGTQQSESEQNLAMFVTQNWLTPNGISFVSQVMVRVNLETQTGAVDGSTSTMANETGGSAGGSANPASDTATGASLEAMTNLASTLAQASLLSASGQQTPAPAMQHPAELALASSMQPARTTKADASAKPASYLIDASKVQGDPTTEALLELIESINGSLSATT